MKAWAISLVLAVSPLVLRPLPSLLSVPPRALSPQGGFLSMTSVLVPAARAGGRSKGLDVYDTTLSRCTVPLQLHDYKEPIQ